jgi:hypothetical protein
MYESLKIETDRLRDLIEENKNLLGKAFALIRTLESIDHDIEEPRSGMARTWLHQPWAAYQAVSAAWF